MTESYIAPKSGAAVAEHVFTFPMALAVLVWLCGVLASSKLFGAESPWQRLLEQMSSSTTGIPLLIAQLGQMWHSQNVRSQLRGVSGDKASG